MPSVAAPEFVAPAHFWVPAHAATAGGEARDLSAACGLDLDPWQAWSLDQMLAEHEDGALAAFEAAVIVGRQNGKGTILEALALYWLFLEEVDLILWSAHEFKTAAEAFRRMRSLLQGAPDLWPLVGRITTSTGNEAIELVTGQRLKFVARSKASGRGFTGDKIILDEAYDLDADAMAALVPTLATRPDPQIVYTSSAGMSDSDVLRGVRDRGRAGGDASLCWLEWCASPAGKDMQGEDVYDLDDRDQWRAANPGYGVRISEGFIEKERRTFLAMPEKFRRERLGVWDDPDEASKPITAADWDACASDVKPDGHPVFFLDVAPDSKSAAIAVAAVGVDGRPHVSLADHGPGTAWVAARVAELRARHGRRWACPVTDETKALLPALAKVGVRPKEFTGAEMGRACAHLQQSVTAKPAKAAHSNDERFTMALAGAVKRDHGDGSWTWGRRKSTTDISPLIAATGALWLLHNRSVPTVY